MIYKDEMLFILLLMIYLMRITLVYELSHFISISITVCDIINDSISQYSDQNRMTARNLASVFGPTLVGSENALADDAIAKIKVVETIIIYALDMFELGIYLQFYLINNQKKIRRFGKL
jgi:RhoGAP domain